VDIDTLFFPAFGRVNILNPTTYASENHKEKHDPLVSINQQQFDRLKLL